MSLNSIKKNYATLLQSFSDAGVKINESQKENLDNFMTDLEKTMNENRDKAILTTKKMVEEKLEKEYKEVVESIIKHQKEHSELAGKVQNKVVELNESNKIADAVDSYLNEYIDEVLPKKTIVDYTRMQKLEKIQESLKEMLVVSEMDVDSKVSIMKEDLEKKNSELTDKIAEYEKRMNESVDVCKKMSKKISEFEAKEFISEKIKDLPVVESKIVLKKAEGMGLEEIKKNYDTILESARTQIREEQEVKEDEKNLEEAITEILERKNSVATPETKSDKDVEGTETSSDSTEGNDEVVTGDDDQPASVPVTESLMQSWIDTLNRITPKK